MNTKEQFYSGNSVTENHFHHSYVYEVTVYPLGQVSAEQKHESFLFTYIPTYKYIAYQTK